MTTDVFGKLFRSMYDGSLVGDWKALVVFQQMVILSDENGVLDMHPRALSHRTSIPLEIILAGIKSLEEPDPASRTPAFDGRRIVRLDAHRDWGWTITNKALYAAQGSKSDRAAWEAERKRRQRDKKVGQDGTVPENMGQSPDTISISKEGKNSLESERGSSSSLLPLTLSNNLLNIVKKEYPRGMHNSLRIETVHEICALDIPGVRERVIAGVKEYAAQVRARKKEGTEWVRSINTFFKNQEWKNEHPLPVDPEATTKIDADRLLKVIRGEIDV